MKQQNNTPLPSQEMRWKQFYASGYEEILKQDFPRETLWKFLERGILADGNRHDALVYFGRRISRQTLIEQVHLWGRVIKGMGLKAGDELLLFGPTLPEVLYIMLAADMTGVTANLPSLMADSEALDSMIGKSRIAFVFDGLEKTIRKTLRRPQFEHVVIVPATPLLGMLHFGLRFRAKYMTVKTAIKRFGQYDGPVETEVLTEKPAYIFCSSGTSRKGLPNQIGMSDEAMISMFRNALAFNLKGNPFCEGSKSYCPLPPFLCTGFFVLVLAPLFRGMTAYLDPRVSPYHFTKNVLAIQPQITLATGAFWVYLFKHIDRLIQKGKRPDLSFFRFPVMGGEGCTPEALKHINEVMEACGSPVALTSGYGLTETFSVSTVDYEPTGFEKDYSRQAVCVGYPFPGVTLGIFDEEGRELGYNQRGEIRVKTPSLTQGYVNDSEQSQARLQDGWLHTQDLGELDSSGKLFVYGRMAQYVMAPGGEKVYLFDMAGRLREDPAVKDALVCPLNKEDKPLMAHVVLKEDNREKEEEVIRRLEKLMSDFLPSGLRIEGYRLEREHLRITVVGKIDRHYYSQLFTGYN
ncbi:MAG: acyl--CoA ligase [Bacteroidales bacterium]|nr:acyl--CoA ligase [Bacteroidales bacterium]